MSTATKEQELLTVRQAAALLHLDERTIRNHINRRRLQASKLPGGKGWLIRREDLFTALEPVPSQTIARPGVVPAGTDPLSVETSGIIRRTNTPEGRARAIAVLDQLREDDTQEQIETLSFLRVALNEDRPSYRAIFPDQDSSDQDSSELPGQSEPA